MNEPNLVPILIYCGAMLLFAIVGAWLVLRPFERARREARRAHRHPAE